MSPSVKLKVPWVGSVKSHFCFGLLVYYSTKKE